MARRLARLPAIRPVVTLKLHVGTDHLIGPRGALLLRGIRDSGSISIAAREAGMSYRSGWSYVSEMSRLVGSALVRSTRGGAKGGGATKLTPTGVEILREYDRFDRRVSRILGSDRKPRKAEKV